MGIALLLPDENMVTWAQKILGTKQEHHVTILRKTEITTVLETARQAIQSGANIIIARGKQAYILRTQTNIPIVDISMTAQELGVMVVRAQKILGKAAIKIGLAAWQGMLCNTSRFNELFGVEVVRYEINEQITNEEIISRAVTDKLDMLLSGWDIIALAKQRGIPALYMEATEESLQQALTNAENLYYMAEVEKHNYAQFSTVLDSSFNGIIKVGQAGQVILMNHVMEALLETNTNEAAGKPLVEILHGLDIQDIHQVLQGKSEHYSTFLDIGKSAIVVVIEPILVEGSPTGAIVSCNLMKRLRPKEGDSAFLNGYTAHGTLRLLSARMPDLKLVTEKAKHYAATSLPILIQGKASEDIHDLCQGIHNQSMRREHAYLMLDLQGIARLAQMDILFGKADEQGVRTNGLLDKAQYGTLVICAAEKLTLQAQHQLMRILTPHFVVDQAFASRPETRYDVRLICCSEQSFFDLNRQNKLYPSFYHLLQTFCITVPDLSARPHDTKIIIEQAIKDSIYKHSRFITVSAEARNAMVTHPGWRTRWQLEAFVEKLIVTVAKRVITQEDVQNLLNELYGPQYTAEQAIASNTVVPAGEREQITLLMQRYQGNRKLIAHDMGISTTTLWRRMQKYGLL